MMFLPPPLAMKVYAVTILVCVATAFFRPALTQSRALPLILSTTLCLFVSKIALLLAAIATNPWDGYDTVSVYAGPLRAVILAAIFAVTFRKTRVLGLRLLQRRSATTGIKKP